jgi:hypothetical protein
MSDCPAGQLSLRGSWRVLQVAKHAFGIAGDDSQIGTGRLIGLGAALSQSRSVPKGMW